MRTTRILSGFVSWRWMPFCALVAGSLLYVGLVVLVVPNSLGKLSATPGSSSFDRTSDTLTTDALGRSSSLPSHHARAITGPTPPRPAGLAFGGGIGAAAPPPRHLAETRAQALGTPPPIPAPPSPPPAREAPAPATTPPEHAAPAKHEAEKAPVVRRRVFSGLHMIGPRVLAPRVVAPHIGKVPAADEGKQQ